MCAWSRIYEISLANDADALSRREGRHLEIDHHSDAKMCPTRRPKKRSKSRRRQAPQEGVRGKEDES